MAPERAPLPGAARSFGHRHRRRARVRRARRQHQHHQLRRARSCMPSPATRSLRGWWLDPPMGSTNGWLMQVPSSPACRSSHPSCGRTPPSSAPRAAQSVQLIGVTPALTLLEGTATTNYSIGSELVVRRGAARQRGRPHRRARVGTRDAADRRTRASRRRARGPRQPDDRRGRRKPDRGRAAVRSRRESPVSPDASRRSSSSPSPDTDGGRTRVAPLRGWAPERRAAPTTSCALLQQASMPHAPVHHPVRRDQRDGRLPARPQRDAAHRPRRAVASSRSCAPRASGPNRFS